MTKSTDNKLQAEDFINALKEMDTYIDVVVDDLVELNRLAERYARMRVTEGNCVADIMSKPVRTVRPDATLSEVAHLFITHRISGAPVVDAKGKLLGIITEADFLRALGVPGHHPTQDIWHSLEALFSYHLELKEPDSRVSDLMVKDVITMSPEQSVHDVIEVMKKNRIKRVIVCDDKHKVVGMITRSDLVRIFFDRIRGDLFKNSSG